MKPMRSLGSLLRSLKHVCIHVIEKKIFLMNDVDQAYMRFAKAALARVSAWEVNGKIPSYQQRGVFFDRDGFRPFERTMSDYSSVLATIYLKDEHFDPIPEAEECARIHFDRKLFAPLALSDSNGKPITNPTFDQLKHWLLADLTFPLREVLEAAGTNGAIESKIVDTYRRYLKHWTGCLPSYELLAPLHGIECSAPNFSGQIDNELSLQRLSALQQYDYWDPNFLRMNVLDFRAIERANLVLIAQVNDVDADRKRIEEKVMRFVTALRLTDAGDVGAPAMMHRVLRRGMFGNGSSLMRGTKSRPHGTIFKLDQNDNFKKAINLYRRLGALDQSNRLRKLKTAIRRLNQSYSRGDVEDQIIDLTIALEATLLHGIKDELRYRLALRGAKVVSDRHPASEAFLFLKALYDLRSAIVHEGDDIDQIVKETEKNKIRRAFDTIGGRNGAENAAGYVRAVLVWLIQKLDSDGSLEVQNIIDGLDNEILVSITKS